MRVVGLITEYNPFHNGHLYHLQESLRITGAEASVAVMSGHFLQRGEPALVDKWVRTEMALAAGLDLVFELPFPFACNSAPYFARGAVQSLNGLGIVDALCFGSEAGELETLQAAASLLNLRADEVERQTAELLRQGVNYPTARARVLQQMAPELPAEQLAAPNNILGLEYLRALERIDSVIEPFTIIRQGPGYYDTSATGQIASATGIRQMLMEGQNVDDYLPEHCRSTFHEARQAGQDLDTIKLFTALLSRLLQTSESLRGIYQVEHGLDVRLTEAAQLAKDYASLAAAVNSRHWTLTRIQRILAYVLLQASQGEMQNFLEAGPLYLRLLGMSETGRKCLAEARSKRTLPIIMDPSKGSTVLRKFYGAGTERARLAEAMLALDLRATRIYTALMKSQNLQHRNRDFFEPVRRGNQRLDGRDQNLSKSVKAKAKKL
ncbi:MAG: nucleotidyltransferase [Desulfuromonadales bacterium]|nr:nucleotidyltransferase [Desulfuromonadales bacterium]